MVIGNSITNNRNVPIYIAPPLDTIFGLKPMFSMHNVTKFHSIILHNLHYHFLLVVGTI